MSTIQHHPSRRRRNSIFERMKQGAGRRIIGACTARVALHRRLVFACVCLFLATPAELNPSTDASLSLVSFAYTISHPVRALPAALIERVAHPGVREYGPEFGDADTLDAPFERPAAIGIGLRHPLTRSNFCNAIVAV